MTIMITAAHDCAKRVCLVVLFLVAVLSSLVHAQVPAIRVDYVRTVTDLKTGETETVAYGSHFISEDGFRTRVDRFRGGEATSEIVRPDVRDPDGYAAERLNVSHSAHEVALLQERYFRPVGAPASPLLTPEEMADSPRWLGYRIIGALVLSGFRVVARADDDTLELWHIAGSPIADTIERRSTMPDGVVDEERVTDVERVTVDESLFEVPAGYRMGRRAPWLR